MGSGGGFRGWGGGLEAAPPCRGWRLLRFISGVEVFVLHDLVRQEELTEALLAPGDVEEDVFQGIWEVLLHRAAPAHQGDWRPVFLQFPVEDGPAYVDSDGTSLVLSPLLYHKHHWVVELEDAVRA